MPTIERFQLSDVIPFCLRRHNTTFADGERYLYSETSELDGIDLPSFIEFSEPTLAYDARRTYSHILSEADIRHVLCWSRHLNMKWTQLGPLKQTLWIRSRLSRDEWSRQRAEEWVNSNCVGDVSIVFSADTKRINFALEEDFILAKLALI